MRSSSIVLFASSLFAVLTGCSAAAEDESASTADSLVSSIWTQTLESSEVDIIVHGSGQVPAGSACAPGAARYAISPNFHMLDAMECGGAPLRERTRNIQLTSEQEAALVAAARAVTTSEKSTCEPSGAPYVQMGVAGYDAARHYSSSIHATDRFACDGNARYATGIERVAEIAAGIAASAPTVPAVFGVLAPSTDPLWTPSASSLFVHAAGAGDMPPGSSCVPGEEKYWLAVAPEMTFTVARCQPADETPGARLAFVTKKIVLSPTQQTRALASLTSLTTSPYLTCKADAEYLSGHIQLRKDDGSPTFTSLRGDQNACVMDADRGAFVKLTALRYFLDWLAS